MKRIDKKCDPRMFELRSSGIQTLDSRFRGNDNGFTLVELLLVVTILGILAAIALPRFFPQAEKSRVAEAIGMLSAIRQGEEAYLLAENGVYCDPDTDCPGGWGSLGIVNPNPGTYFTYTVPAATITAGPPPTFVAVATRNGVNDPGGNTGSTVTLDDQGCWIASGSTHPNAPTQPC